MKIKDFFNVLIHDDDINVSIQTKDDKGCVQEIHNDGKLFSRLDDCADKTIQYIKIENKKIYIIT